MKKRGLFHTITICVIGALLAGCGSSNVDGTKVEKNGKMMVVACSNTAEPYSYVENGEHKGFEVDMWNEIAKRTGYEVKMETMGFSSIFGALDSGKVDVAGNFFGKTEERLEKYNASVSYGHDGVGVAVLSGNTDINTIDDLKGKKVAVAEGSQGQAVGETVSKEKNFELTIFGDGTSGVQDLALNRSDAWMDSKITLSFDSAKAGVNIRILDAELSSSNVGYFFRKNDAESDTKREAVDKALEAMLKDGTVKQLSEKWFHRDVTEGVE